MTEIENANTSVEPLDENQCSAKEPCKHFYHWLSPAEASGGADVCTYCHWPNPDWLNRIVELKDGEDVCYSDDKTLEKCKLALTFYANENLSSIAQGINWTEVLLALNRSGILFRESRRD